MSSDYSEVGPLCELRTLLAVGYMVDLAAITPCMTIVRWLDFEDRVDSTADFIVDDLTSFRAFRMCPIPLVSTGNEEIMDDLLGQILEAERKEFRSV